MQKFKNASPNTKLAIGIVMAIVSLGFFIGLANILLEAQEVRQWPKTEGEVLKSELQKERRDGSGGGGFITGRTVSSHSYVYCPYVEYTYTVQGKLYTSTDIDPFGSKTCYSEYSAPDISSSYPVGSHPTVYYHPRRPFQAALETQVSWKLLIQLTLFALGFGIFAFIVIRSGYYGKKFEKIAAEKEAEKAKLCEAIRNDSQFDRRLLNLSPKPDSSTPKNSPDEDVFSGVLQPQRSQSSVTEASNSSAPKNADTPSVSQPEPTNNAVSQAPEVAKENMAVEVQSNNAPVFQYQTIQKPTNANKSQTLTVFVGKS